MVLTLLAYAATDFNSVDYLLRATARANASRPDFVAVLQSTGTAEGASVRDTYTVTVRRPGQGSILISDTRTGDKKKEIIVDGKDRYVVDHKTRQYKREKREADTDLRKALFYGDMTLDPLVLALVSEDGVKQYFEELKRQGQWEAVRGAGGWRLISKNPGGTVEAGFQDGTLRLSRLNLTAGKGTWNWSVQYRPIARTAAFVPPRSIRRVREFGTQFLAPVYANAAARRATERMFAAYDNLSSLSVEMDENGRKTTVMVRGERIRQTDDQADWSYDGSKVTIVVPSSRRAYQGAAESGELEDMLAALNARIDPTVKRLLMGENPFRDLLAGRRVEVEGEMTVAGNSADLLTATGAGIRVSLVVRRSDGRVLSAASMPMQTGQGSSSQKTFRYLAAASDSSLQVAIPAGFETGPAQRLLARK